MDIQKVKEYILDIAIRGKLVAQDLNDEPASELIKKIQQEKDKLINEGNLKKGKELPPITNEEKLFEIPSSWKWIRLGDITRQITDGTHKTPNYIQQGVPFLSVQNISSGKFDLTKIKYISQEEHTDLIKRCRPEKNDILLCRIGTLGKAITVDLDFEFSIFVSLALIKPFGRVKSEYLKYIYNSKFGTEFINNVKVGGGSHTSKINLIDIPNMVIPLPPVEEQKRIVNKIEELFSILDNLEKEKKEYYKYKQLLKDKVLELAIKGKLVEQDSNDEPASELIKRIQKEKEQLIEEGKIKRDKELEPITEEEKAFEIPNTWEWLRLTSISNIRSGGTPDRTNYTYWSNGTIPWIKIKDIKEKYIFESSEHITEEGLKNSSATFFEPETILYTIFATLGEISILKNKATTNQAIAGINLFKNTNVEYIYYYLKTIKEYITNIGRGAVQNNINLAILKNIIVPLPPLNEQKRIVKKINEIFCKIEILDEMDI